MKTIFIILATFLLLIQNSFGQYTSEESDVKKKENPLNKLTFKDRLYTGGNMALNFQNSWVYFEASPYVGYKVTEKFSAGVGVKYIYVGSKQYNINWSIYGGNIFSRYLFTRSLFAHAEFELLRAYDLDPNSTSYYQRDFAPMLFAGAGYSSSLGGRVTVQFLLLYDFINSLNSPYRNNYLFGPVGPPIAYRIGFNIGL